MLAVIVGLVFALAGLWGVCTWWGDFIVVSRGMVPFMIFVGGCISIVAGFTAIRDALDDTKKSREVSNQEKK